MGLSIDLPPPSAFSGLSEEQQAPIIDLFTTMVTEGSAGGGPDAMDTEITTDSNAKLALSEAQMLRMLEALGGYGIGRGECDEIVSWLRDKHARDSRKRKRSGEDTGDVALEFDANGSALAMPAEPLLPLWQRVAEGDAGLMSLSAHISTKAEGGGDGREGAGTDTTGGSTTDANGPGAMGPPTLLPGTPRSAPPGTPRSRVTSQEAASEQKPRKRIRQVALLSCEQIE